MTKHEAGGYTWAASVRVGHEMSYEFRHCGHQHRSYEAAMRCGNALARRFKARPTVVLVRQAGPEAPGSCPAT
jgi:hypothetical protein